MPTRPEIQLQMMEFSQDVPLSRVVEMQGFDARTPSQRSVFLILDWSQKKSRTKYNLSLIFDGDQSGLELISADYDGSALCVGRGVVQVGADETVSQTFSREFATGDRSAVDFLRSSSRSMDFGESSRPVRATFGPFSKDQQLYAAGMLEAGLVTLYGFRARWPVEKYRVEEQYFLLQSTSLEDALAVALDHLRGAQDAPDLREIFLEVDDMRLETIVSQFSIFTWSRVSSLDPRSFVETFHLGNAAE